MKFPLKSALLLTACILATMSSIAEAGIGLNACNNKCQVKLSYAAEKCVKTFPVTDSDARLLCNTPPVEAERKCEDRCSKVSRKCSEKCFLKANTDWEPCVTEHKDPIDPKRIQCIKDVQNAYVKCYAPC